MAFGKALPPLLTPLIIIGGILSGIFTPTEAAGVAAFYGLILGLFIYKELKWRDIYRVFLEVGKTSSSIMIIISMSSVFAYILAYEGIAQKVADLLLGFSTNPLVIFLIINILLLLVGCFMEPMSVLLVLIPMLLPVVDKVGIDRLHFGVVAVLNLMIGLITPPVGVCLYVVARIANISFERTVKGVWPFVITLAVVLFLITYVPVLVTFLPNLIFK
jgi:tripartite ATP-independent transporter DctM subunit